MFPRVELREALNDLRCSLLGISDDSEVTITRVHSSLGQVGAPGCGLS